MQLQGKILEVIEQFYDNRSLSEQLKQRGPTYKVWYTESQNLW